MSLHPKIKPALDKILELFRSGNLPKAVAVVTFPPFDVPSNDWSFCNRLIMAESGTSDARGFRQWKSVGRYVKKGSKAIYILAPNFVKRTLHDRDMREFDNTGSDQTGKMLWDFEIVPVFRVEDTGGKPLDNRPLELPRLPLLDLAAEWGIKVTPVAFQDDSYGCYRPDFGEIRLATPEERIFFHEIAHAAHHKVKGSLRSGQEWRQEIVAELAAQVLCHIVGVEPDRTQRTLGNSYEYISSYASTVNMKPLNACLAVISDIEKVLNLILKESAAL